MFTGLVEHLGTLTHLVPHANASDLTVDVGVLASDASIGDSIAINGCCLTAVAIENQTITFQAGSETLSRTNLGQLAVGDRVNLERSLKVGQRMGGHFVSGHVDALGTVHERNDDGQWAEFWFEVPSQLTRQMASKGSVTVDGVSLTLVQVEEKRFSVALIPHTLSVTTLGNRNVGDSVNIETDILAKYVTRSHAGG